MATARSQEAIYSLVEYRTLELETEAGSKPDYNGVVVIEDILLVTDYYEWNLHLYRLNNGTLLSSHRLESRPYGVCLISKTHVAVCLVHSKIVIVSFKSIDDVKRVKTLDVSKGFILCYSVVKLNSNKLLVSGRNYDDMLCWCVVSITDGRLDSTHSICKWYGRTHMAIKDNTVYISCRNYDSITRGVYAFDILNPHTHKFLYQHKELKTPWSIMADRNSVFVCDRDSNRIHQLTDSGQLVTIHTLSSRLHGIFYDDQHGVLYTTMEDRNLITLYKMKYLHQPGVPLEILNMDHRSIQLFEEALKDGKETVHNIRIMVVGHMGVGKTTLVKRLLGQEVHISERCSTEGIDVYVNCCDVSLSTHEWTRRTKDSEQDYILQRLVKVLNDISQTRDRVAFSEQGANSKQRERTDNNPMSHNVVEDKNTEVLYQRSQNQILHQNLSSTSSQQDESPSTVVATMPESKPSENVATESHKTDPLREMLKLLQQNPIKVKKDVSRYAYLTILDFAGQYAFYTTHQMFLTRRAIYLLVSDASKDVSDIVEDKCYFDSQGTMMCRVHDLVEVWMNSIHSCAPPDKENLSSASSNTSSYEVIPPPVILVGTHIDRIPQRYCRKHGLRYLKKIRSYLRDKPTVVHLVDEDFAIDNTVLDSKLEDLKKKIVEVASQQPYWGEQIPTRWFLLEQQLMKLRDAGVKVISRSTLEDLNKEGTVQIKDAEEMDVFLKYLHETGTVIYFSIEVLRDNIVLDPKWLIDALKSLINAQPNLPSNATANGTDSNSPAAGDPHSDISQKWSDFKEKGILTLELVDVIWTKENYPELHANKDHILRIMEQLNIFAKPRSFNEMGEKVEDYFLAPCMLCQESPTEVISPEEDPCMVSTPDMFCSFTGKYLPTPIFHRLLAACVAHWPVAKKKETSENLIFCGCCVFDLDLFHRLTVYIRNHVVFARITRMVIDEAKTPDAKLCSRVRRFITLNLSKITSYLGQNLQYELHASFQTWHADEGHDPDTPITHEHMNHARLCVALVTVCGNALRDILLTNFPVPYKDIYQTILANKTNLTSKREVRPGQWQNALLNKDLSQVVFPDPKGRYVAIVEQFDISMLYTLIRNVSAVPAPSTHWGNDPLDNPRDVSLGASVERIRSYRNHIVGHSMDGKISQQDFDDYWNKIDAVLEDIERALGRQGYRAQLEKHKRQVISVYEAC